METEALQRVTPKRSVSTSTHRSQTAAWTAPDEEVTSVYAAKMIAKVLRSKYAARHGNELFSLPLQRAFHQLDWRNAGWLARGIVEEQCRLAQIILNVTLEHAEIARLIKAEDEKDGTPDHHIDEPEFINIVLSLREELRSSFERQSVATGLVSAVKEIILWQRGKKEYAISNLWTSADRLVKVRSRKNSTDVTVTVFSHTFGGNITPNSFPLARNTTNALYLATKYCVSSVDLAVNRLRPILNKWEALDREEVDEVLNTTIDTIAMFHHFESPKGLDTYHWLDEFIDSASTLPLSFSSDLEDCPGQQAIGLVTNIWSVLDRVLGLVNEIHLFAFASAKLSKWRKTRVLDRARALAAEASSVFGDERKTIFKEMHSWYDGHRSVLHKHQASCLNTTETLKKQQLDVLDTATNCTITIHASLKDLPKVLSLRGLST